jgi:hypothetical protein
LIAPADVTALLRHRATIPRPLGFVDPPLGRAIAVGHLVNYWVAGFAGRSFIANVDVAIAHDCYPLLKLHHNAQLLRRVACDQRRSSAVPLWFTVAEQPEPLLHQRKIKNSHWASNPAVIGKLGRSRRACGSPILTPVPDLMAAVGQ